jgi:exopolysaccharide production protein ExoZ
MARIHTTLPLPGVIRQIDSLQILRAVAVLLVAWPHAGQTLGFMNVLPHFAVFGIDIFFVISGFIIASVLLRMKQEPGPGAMWSFLKRRLIRIFPIYWFFWFVESARFLHGHGFFLQNYFPSFLLLPGLFPRYPLIVGFSWTLVFEIFFYYVLAAILLVTVKRAIPVAMGVFAAVVLIGHFVGLVGTGLIIVANPMLLEFTFGATVALLFARVGKRRKLGRTMVIVGVAMAFYLRAHPEHGGASDMHMILGAVEVMRRVLTWGLSAVLIVGGVIFWSPEIKTRAGRTAVVLGNASYSAYLASSLIMEFAARLLIRPDQAFSLGRVVLYQTLLVVAVFVGGWACYQFVEWPMLRWLRRILLAKEESTLPPQRIPA